DSVSFIKYIMFKIFAILLFATTWSCNNFNASNDEKIDENEQRFNVAIEEYYEQFPDFRKLFYDDKNSKILIEKDFNKPYKLLKSSYYSTINLTLDYRYLPIDSNHKKIEILYIFNDSFESIIPLTEISNNDNFFYDKKILTKNLFLQTSLNQLIDKLKLYDLQ